jgi:hypothetical protein
MIMRDNECIETLYEPIGATEFLWEETEGNRRRYLTQGGATVRWGIRDLFIYDYDSPIPYKMVRNSLKINNELLDKADNPDLDKEVMNAQAEGNIPKMIEGLSSSEFDDVVASNLMGHALAGLQGYPTGKSSIDIMHLLLIGGIIVIFIWAFF